MKQQREHRGSQGKDDSWVAIEGIGFWAPGLPNWQAARAFAATGCLADDAPLKPSARLLAPNERRRAPETVSVALEVALAACQAAQRDPATLPSVFASTHGDLAVTDHLCATLARDPHSVSPIKFHNSVHNAAAGYWTIGVGAMQPATALSAFDASFAQALIEAVAVLAAGANAVLVVAYDSQAQGPLSRVSRSEGLLGGALVLAVRSQTAGAAGLLRLHLEETARRSAAVAAGPLERHSADNAMAQMLPLFDALATDMRSTTLVAGEDRMLRVDLASDAGAAHA